jgi:1-phosphatidylinositol-4-phosphate 5-kinase
LDGIGVEDILESLDQEKNRYKVFEAGEGAGKSGSFFFYTHDRRFIIKTILKSERKFILRTINKQVRHLRANGNRSLLSRIYGVFTLTTNYFAPLELVLMQNSFNPVFPQSRLLKFEIKGTTMKRTQKVGAVSKLGMAKLSCSKKLLDGNLQ